MVVVVVVTAFVRIAAVTVVTAFKWVTGELFVKVVFMWWGSGCCGCGGG